MNLIIPVVVLVGLTIGITLLFKYFFFSKNVQFTSQNDMTEVEKLMVIKYPEVDVHKNRRYTLIAGLFVTMIFALILVEQTAAKEKEVVKEKVVSNEMVDEPITMAPPPPPPPPPPPAVKAPVMVLVVVPDLPPEIDTAKVEPLEEEEEERLPIDDDDEEDEEEEEEEDDEIVVDIQIYENVSASAVPPNGNLFMFIDEYVVTRMNGEAIQPDLEAGRQGFFEIQFVVEKDGSISNVEILTSVGPYIDAEIQRILSSSRWKPAENQGSIVRQKMILDTYIEY